LKLTAIDIAEMLYSEDKAFKRRVSADCLTLYEQNRLTRDGKGSAADPYVYGIPPIAPLRSSLLQNGIGECRPLRTPANAKSVHQPPLSNELRSCGAGSI
jgi:hypothetical protein